MLTNNDLGKIKKIIHDGIKPVQIDVTGLKIDVKSLKTGVKGLEANITGLKKDVKKIRKNVDIIIDSFDRENLSSNRRISRIETHLQLKPLADF
ncbi:hypothetical protein KKE48_04635 [Patescibacteria group bacterium]|nr:hypothetical protein [Patescibacteria group bacterium]MBU1500124.1 hypothetical protein [Patescibacteria group bacterium]